MQDLIAGLLMLVVGALAFSIMLRPIAPGFSNTFNQRLGNCAGRGVTAILVIALAFFLIQTMFQSCAQKFNSLGNRDKVSVESPAPSMHQIPDIPLPPDSHDIGIPLLVQAPVSDYEENSFNRPLGAHNAGMKRDLHLGEDIRLPAGEPVFAAAEGKVVHSAPADRYGRVVVMEHRLPDGTRLLTIYGHLSSRQSWKLPQTADWYRETPTIPKGSAVQRGQLIGFVGTDSENGDGSEHLHMGLRILDVQSGFEPDASGYWYAGYGYSSDLADISSEGEVVGEGSYLPFSKLMRFGLKGLTATAK